MGAVRPGNLIIPEIAIEFADGQIARIIQNDLMLADIGAAPSNSAGAAAAHAKDRGVGAEVDYDAWTAAGVTYVLRGTASGSPQAELYDVASRVRVFGNSYEGAGTDQARLAHRVADDVMQAVSKLPGIFSSRIACLTGKSAGNKEIAVMDPDGLNQRVLTRENSIVAAPTWGRQGLEIFFTSYKDNNPDLYGITLDGRRFTVSRFPGLNTSPSWNDSIQRLALTLAKDGNTEIYTMDSSGGNLARLTRTAATVTDTAPEWSPDGAQLAFTSDDGGSPQIYIMSVNGGGRRKITNAGYCDSPAWSPDGKHIAYTVREKGQFNIYMVDAQGGAPVQLTQSAGDNTDPSWGPSGQHLVFASTRTGGRNLHILNVLTKSAKPITTGGTFSSPDWGPLRQ